MPGVVRASDCDSKGISANGSPNISVNNLGMTRMNDCSSATKIGIHTVKGNNMSAQVIGDGVSNGHCSVAGSDNVFADGG